MAALDTSVEWLRALIANNKKPWDYCVIWKLGDDPSRFIEWGACCCSGGNIGNIKIKDEIRVDEHLIGECKDKLIKHPIRTKACEVLAKLPPVIPLYSGIHGDVVISKEPRWIDQSIASPLTDGPSGTQVLIPVPCGLIELFSTKHVPKDQKIIDYIFARFTITVKQENMTDKSYTDDFQNIRLPSLDYKNFLPPINYSSYEGSSTCSSLSTEHQTLNVASDQVFGSISPEKSSREYVDSPSISLGPKRKNYADFSLVHENDKLPVKIKQKAAKGPYKSKNLVTERKRRKKINDGMLALRALVPKITKMDRVATLGDAADYIEELNQIIDNYRDELIAMEEEDRREINGKSGKTDLPVLIKNCADKSGGASNQAPAEVQVEVSQIGVNGYLVKYVCKQQRGGFARLMEAMDSLGLLVTDANVTTLNGSVLNVLKVEANTTDMEPTTLKHSLMLLVD